jgi:hypothetical protein
MFSDGTGRLKTFFAVNILLSLCGGKNFYHRQESDKPGKWPPPALLC